MLGFLMRLLVQRRQRRACAAAGGHLLPVWDGRAAQEPRCPHCGARVGGWSLGDGPVLDEIGWLTARHR